MSTSEYLTTAEAAEHLGLAPATLAWWRSTKTQTLAYVKVGGRVRYLRADLDAWLASRRVTA